MNSVSPAIDIVIPWVDGSDPAWLQEYRQYQASEQNILVATCDASTARYRDWDLLHFWFRSIEAYAPWVRKIHFVTWGHLPAWLNLDHPKLAIVRHSDFIPAEYLPTFSSHTIELNLHRIPDLAEHFLYFNDDVYLTHSTQPADFFIDGKPCDTAILGVIKQQNLTDFMPYTMLNMLGVINSEFDKRAVLRRHRRLWYSLKYGKGLLKNLYLSPWSTFTGFVNYHRCNPFQKQTFCTVWERYGAVLDATCRRKFRTRSDVNQYIFRYWQLCSGEFVPTKPSSEYVTIGKVGSADIRRLLYDRKYNVVCINDDPEGFDFAEEQLKLMRIFEEKYEVVSAFER